MVLYCVEWDTETPTQCTQEAWMPPPSLLPPLSVEQAGVLLSALLVLLATAYGVNQVVRQIFR